MKFATAMILAAFAIVSAMESRRADRSHERAKKTAEITAKFAAAKAACGPDCYRVIVTNGVYVGMTKPQYDAYISELADGGVPPNPGKNTPAQREARMAKVKAAREARRAKLSAMTPEEREAYKREAKEKKQVSPFRKPVRERPRFIRPKTWTRNRKGKRMVER